LQHDELHFLREHASEYGIHLSEQQLGLFGSYLNELVLWNRHVNLTGVSTRERMIIELFLDSLIPAPHIPEEGRVLDVGSGAGFPGLPLKIYRPGLDLSLLEAKSKRVSFLKHVIRLLGLSSTKTIKGRIEKDMENLHPDGYTMITARAVAPLFQTMAWCAPFLKPDGLLVCFLGSGVQQALDKSGQIMERQGVYVYERIPYFLPGKKSERNVLIFRKETPVSE
jgi:16S rRNA (guanine527-N7)-methyltransferase